MSYSPNLSTYHPKRDSGGTGESTAGKFFSLPAHPSSLMRDSNGTGGSAAGEVVFSPAHKLSLVHDSNGIGGSAASEFEFPPAHTLSLVRDSDDTRDFLFTPAHPSFEAPF